MSTPTTDSDRSLGSATHPAEQTVRLQQARVVGSMYIGYAMFMVLRMAPAPVSNSIIDDPNLGIGLGEWGRIMSMGTVGAVIGKFIGGYAADRLGGRVTFAIGLLVCSLGIAAFSVSTSLWMFQAAFFVALMAKSSGWPGMTRIVGQSFHPVEYGRVWGILSTSSRVGTIVATFGLGLLVALVSWQTLLIIAGVTGIVVAVAFNVYQKSAAAQLETTRAQNSSTDTSHEPETAALEDHPLHGTTVFTAIGRFCLSLQFWLITGSLTGLTILWDFIFFLPAFLKDTIGVSESAANATSTAFPVGSFISVLAGGFVFDLLSRRSTAWVMVALLLVAAACIGAFYQMQLTHLSHGTAVMLATFLLFTMGLCIAPCYYIPMSVFSIQFGGPHAGFLVAMLDAIAFAFNAAFYWFAGDVAEASWNLLLIVLGTISLTAALLTFVFMLGESKKYDQMHEAPA